MKKNFNLYEELEALGFEEQEDEFGRACLVKQYEKEVEVCWYGKHTSRFGIVACFNESRSIATVYFYDGTISAFKTKTYLNEKRALNAIRETAKYKGFEL